MKKSILILSTFFFSFLAFSQQVPQNQGGGKGQNHGQSKSPEQKAEAATKKWTSVLNLSAEQQPKVKQIFLDKATKMQSIRSKYSGTQDKKPMHEEVKKAKTDADNSLKQVLTPQQYDQFIKTREEHKKQHAEHKAGQPGQKTGGDHEDDEDND